MEGEHTTNDANMAKSGTTIERRVPVKSRSHFDYSVWKQKLRDNCFRRVREDRSRLLWKLRLSDSQSSDEKDYIKSAFEDIVYDEIKKIKDSSRHMSGNLALNPVSDDILWEYEGIKDAYEGDSEEILLEMQQIFYQDLVSETTTINGSCDQVGTWEDEEDDYLATLVSQNMFLNTEQELNRIWCPICKQGELLENHQHIYCNNCEMQLSKGEEVNLTILQERLAEAHAEHLERGCRLQPKFCVQGLFNLKALYIKCQACTTFEVIV